MIRPLREDEFAAWYDGARAGYARDIEESGGVPHDAARQKAVDDMRSLWPDGWGSPEQDVYALDDDDGEAVGYLWLCDREGMSGRQLFVYELRVEEAHRGKGHGRTLMKFAEEEARRRELPRIALNVFGGNEVARGLYRSLGYYESAVFMVKEL